MGNYLDKWKTLFPEVVGGTKRPLEAISDQEEFNTNGFPQFIAQDPVRYDLQNAFLKQFLSNDAWLWVKQQQANQALDKHKGDAQAHPNGISGNAASATKLRTPRALNLSGAVTADAASFDGTADVTINVKTLDASKLKGTASVSTTGNAATASKLLTPRTISLTGKAAGSTTFDGSTNASINVTSVNADTASKLSTARKISITGNATGAANFDGSGDVSINVNVNESKHAAAATTVNATAPNGGAADLAFGTMAVNDYARIRVYGKDDKGALEIATADGGDEPIYARQYGGADWPNGRPGTVMNEAAILDSNGNTKFPKNVTAASFTGPLNGTATKAAQDTNGRAFTDTNAYMHISTLANGTDFNNVKTTGVYTCIEDNYPNRPRSSWGVLRVYNFCNVKQEYIPDNTYEVWERYFSRSWSAWSKVAASTADTCTGNASTATKLQTPRTISLTGNASGSANFDGSGNISINTTVNNSAAANALNIDTYRPADANVQHGDGKIRYFLATSAMSKNKPPTGDGQIIDLAWDTNFGWDCQLFVNNTTGRLNMRGQIKGEWTDWLIGLDSGNFNDYAPTKTGGGASGTWGINISGTAAKATTAADCSGNSATATKLQTARSIALTGNATGSATFDGSGNISISTNVNTATNADKLDGYHASDLFRHLGGNQTPVITDIFDRAGTIDMTTMSAADKATHKANINKASNASQNLWNTDTGIRAYGGDYDMAGYNRGTLKLTQSYKNFDKILVVGVNDKCDLLIYKLWDVWALANAFASGSWFQLFHGGNYWFLYGSTRKGTRKDYALSSDTVWSCQDQNSGIVAIYGIKY